MVWDILACGDAFTPPVWFQCVISFNHFLLVINSSVNFLIYVSVGKDFKKTIRKFCQCTAVNSKYSSKPSNDLPVIIKAQNILLSYDRILEYNCSKIFSTIYTTILTNHKKARIFNWSDIFSLQLIHSLDAKSDDFTLAISKRDEICRFSRTCQD